MRVNIPCCYPFGIHRQYFLFYILLKLVSFFISYGSNSPLRSRGTLMSISPKLVFIVLSYVGYGCCQCFCCDNHTYCILVRHLARLPDRFLKSLYKFIEYCADIRHIFNIQSLHQIPHFCFAFDLF